MANYMIDPNTLYYSFSSIPQILGAMTGLLVAFVHFRVTRLEDYLIGDGQSIYDRRGEPGVILSTKQEKRLKDAISRKNFYEIKPIIKMLSETEKAEGFTKKDRSTGLQYIYEDRFCGTENQIISLKRNTLFSTVLSLITIITSLICLVFVDSITISNCSTKLTLTAVVLLTIITLIFSFVVIYNGLLGTTTHETDRAE